MTGLLAVSGLTRYFGGVHAIDDVSFDISEGEIAAIIGPNGAGKTTLFNLISGFLEPDSGNMSFRGRRLTGHKPHQIAAQGLVRTFQLVRLFSEQTALDNVITGFHLRTKGGLWDAIVRGRGAVRQELDIARKAGELLDFVGLGSSISTLAAHLTYGQQRLLEIARALAAQPSLLLLDEPAAGLNAAETQALANLVRAIRDQGVTILFIEHDMNIVMGVADKVIVLDFGRKIAEGSPKEVQSAPAVLAAYLGVET
jgi:branched-chain amino acid transport system ATP-binding protein